MDFLDAVSSVNVGAKYFNKFSFKRGCFIIILKRMDNSKKRLLQRVIRRIPARMLRTTLEKWDRLTGPQRRSLDFTQTKLALTENLVAIFEVRVVLK